MDKNPFQKLGRFFVGDKGIDRVKKFAVEPATSWVDFLALSVQSCVPRIGVGNNRKEWSSKGFLGEQPDDRSFYYDHQHPVILRWGLNLRNH